MANYANIKDTINQSIKPNGNQQITGQVLQNVLNAIVDNLTAGYLLVGIATEDGNPGTPDQNLCWLATQGTYTNYGNITVESGKLAVIKYNGTWTSDTVDVQGAVTAGDGIAISDEGAVSVKTGTGVKIDEGGNVAANLVAGDYISIEGNKISCTLDANPFYFVDVLPDSPVPGTENKVYVVPDTASTALNLYQWNAETSEFDLVGTIDLGVNPDEFIKKGQVNDVEATTVLNSLTARSQKIIELRRLNNLGSGVGLLLRIEAEDDGGFDTIQKAGSIDLSSTDGLKLLTLRVYSAFYRFAENGNLTVNAGNNKLWQFLKGVIFSVSSYNWSNTGNLPYEAIIYMALQLNLTDKITILLQDGTDGPIHLVLDAFESDGVITMTYFANGKLLKAVIDSTAETITIEEGILSLLGTGDELIFRPTFYIEAPAGESWDSANSTFSIPGIYSKLNTVLALNADVVLTYPSRQVVIATDLQSFGDGQDILMTYRFSSLRFTLTIKSDDSITIASEPYIWRFVAADYGISAWYNASGTNVNLYNDLKKLINGTNNAGGILGYLCDNSNVFAIANICFSDGTLVVGFYDANAQIHRALNISSNGAFRVWTKEEVLVLNNASYGVTSWFKSGGGTSASLATVLKNLKTSQPVIFYDSTGTHAGSRSTLLYMNSTRGMLTVVYSANKIGSVTGLGNACPANSIVINSNTNEYNINAN